MRLKLLTRRKARQPRSAPDPLPPHIAEIRQRALLGHVLDQVRWGDILLSDQFGPRDPEGAYRWFEIAANAGFAPALNMLGRCHHFGWACTQDFGVAARYYREATARGDLWGCYNLGILTMRGLGMAADQAAALALFRQAAAGGHAKSMNLVGRFTEEGWHTPRDPIAALDWYRRSAEGGDYRGQHNYATALLALGQREAALDWWRKAAPEATTDILLAMARRLEELGTEGDTALLTQARERLKRLMHHAEEH